MNHPHAPFPVTVASPEDLSAAVMAGLGALHAVSDLLSAVTPYMEAVHAHVRDRSGADQACLTMRALLALQAVMTHRRRLLAEGLVVDVEKGFALLPELVAGVAAAPCKAKLNGDRVKLTYQVNDVVSLAKKSAMDRSRSRVVKSADPKLADFDTGPIGALLEDAFGRQEEGKTIGDILREGTPVAAWRPTAEQFPTDALLCAYRDRQMSALSAIERRVFECERLDDNHSSVQLVSRMIGIMPPDLQVTMAKMSGFGPWSFYAMLDERKDWDYRVYRDVVLSGSLTASVPCRRGCYPAHYVAKHGTVEDFERVLDLYPLALRTCDLAGRPLVVDLCELRTHSADKLELALKRGADPNAIMPTGMSAFVFALQRANFDCAELLFDAGYGPWADESLDQVAIDAALRRPECRGGLRVLLSEMRDYVKPCSYLSEMVESVVGSHEKGRAGGGFAPRRSEH